MREKIKRKNSFFVNIKRLCQIIYLAKKHKIIRALLKVKKNYQRGLSPKEAFRTSKNLKEFGIRLREFFEDAGPTFIKFGQILSLQIDVLPKEIYEELEKLQDKVPGFSFEEAKKIIEKELEAPIEKIFDSFGKTPIAAASLAQVHKAKLKTGEEVAVKVIRPNIKQIINRDTSLIRFLSNFINLKKINLDKEYLDKILREFEEFILTELNFQIEGRNMIRMSRILGKEIIIPKVYPRLSTPKLLVMEWIDCTKITNLRQIEKWKLDREKIISKVVESYLRQILVYGLFHGDPHPANIGITKKGEIVLFDFGVVGSLSLDYRRSSIKMVHHMLNLDSEAYLSEFLKANKIKKEEVKDFDEIVEGIDNLLEDYNKSIIPDYNQCTAEIMKLFNKYKIRNIHNFVVLVRTLTVLGLVTKIYEFDDRDSLEIFKKVSKELMKKDLWGVFNFENIGEQVIWTNRNFREFLENPKEFLEKNMPVLTMRREKLDDKEEEEATEKAEARYRSFGIYKFPFFSLLFFLTGALFLNYYPYLIILNYPLYVILFCISGVILVFSLFYLMYLDFILDKRVEIYKYPFFAFVFLGAGFFLFKYMKQTKILGYEAYIYSFIFGLILTIYSLVHLFRVLKYKIGKELEKEVKKRI